MTNLSISHDNFLISNDIVKTTSMKVAQCFNKNHRDVARRIKTLDCSDDFRCANFCAHPYINEQNGERYTLWEMTKDGFMFLVMGFTGKKAARIKEAYINSFNQMAELLKPKTLSPAHQRTLQNAVAVKVDHNRALSAKVWGAIKDKFKVPRYSELPDSSFDLVLTFVQNFKLSALPAHQLMDTDKGRIGRIKMEQSSAIRAHALGAARLLAILGEGYRDGAYYADRLIDLGDMEKLVQARKALFKMENLLLNFNIENDPFFSKKELVGRKER